jgi:hypothetical protein
MTDRQMKSTSEKSVVVNACIEALERILRDQIEMHRHLLQCISRKKVAISTAHITDITKLCGEENVIVQRLAESEKHRLALVGKLTQVLDSKAAKPLTVMEIAAQAREPQQSRIAALAAQLRESLEQVQRESSIVRTAADALGRHMSGIMQTVHAALSRARVYGQRGRIAIGVQMPSVLDIKS